ncbi:mononuclear molybdenum enzyme YedY, partial [Vibrio cholerae O1]|nr:mononuclear molybdenum enzyme YedY [Vibrio cholerae O1]
PTQQALASVPSTLADARLDEALTPYSDATTYNNYYEFGLDKGDPAKNAHHLPLSPWQITVEGLVHKPGT